MPFVKLRGASCHTNDDMSRTYTERGPVWVNTERVTSFYDHKVIMSENQVVVMETGPELAEVIAGDEERIPE